MMLTAFAQFMILLLAMLASAAIGYWIARQKILSSTNLEELNKMAKTIEQLRERATQAEADKVRALIASDRDRKRAEAWRPHSRAHPAE